MSNENSDFKYLGTPLSLRGFYELVKDYRPNTPLAWKSQAPQELGVVELYGKTALCFKAPYAPPEHPYIELAAKIFEEMESAEAKHPDWPTDILHQIAIVNEESGEATRAALHVVYEKGTIEAVESELIQTAAMCLRMLKNLKAQR